jgi:AhpC/TSA family
VPDDRFADLGPGDADRRSAAERFAELDERDPEPKPKAPEPRRPSGRYTWVVGIAFVIAIIVAGANALRHSGAGYKGIPTGRALAPFAAPLATSNHDNDATIQAKRGGGHPAACDVRGAGIVNLCDLRRRPLVVTFVANGGGGCDAQLGRVDRVRSGFPGVNFLGVITRKSLSDAKRMVLSHGWGFPVALDRDTALFNLYGIGDCPTTIFARTGGRSAGTRRGDLSELQLTADIRALVQGRAIP